MKIIHVLSGLVKGGGERVAVELANQSAKNGDIVTILAGWPENPGYLQNKIHPDVTVKFITSAKGFAYLKIIPWILTHRTWICSHHILHCHLTFGAFFGALASILLKKILRKKGPVIVETNHAVGMPVPKFNRWLHSLLVSQLNGMVVMAKDPYWNNFIRKHPYLKFDFIPNGISTVGIENSLREGSMVQQTGIPENYKYIIGSVSMLRTDRKPWLYVQVFHEIYKALGSDTHFILGGTGEEYDNIENLVKEKGLTGNFHLIGLVNDPAKVIANMDVYISLSVGDMGGISMIEAAMCNVPVIGIQMVENYKAKNDDWVWSHTDSAEVAKKIIFLLKNPGDRDKLKEDQNIYVKKHFTAEAMYNGYNYFYQQILPKE